MPCELRTTCQNCTGCCKKYRDQPISLADACIVRMAELYDRHSVLTLDSDFLVYRKHGRVPLAVLYPADR